jgi:hypothetical protein
VRTQAHGEREATATSDEVASRLRQSLARLREETAHLLEVFMRREPVVRGSVYELRRKCGKASCACASGEALHATKVISWSSDGRKHLRALSPREQLDMAHLVSGHRRLRRARARLVELQAEILVVVDKLESLRRREP